jgi:branched-subunit amino acid ABC-type transport system permease component
MPELLPFVISGLGVGAVYALSGVGLVVLYRSSGVLNFAFGALGAVAAYVAWSALDHEWPRWLQSRLQSEFRLPTAGWSRPACRTVNRQYAQ